MERLIPFAYQVIYQKLSNSDIFVLCYHVMPVL